MFNFFIDDTYGFTLLHGHHNPGLVAVSIGIAIATSIMGLQIAGMARNARGKFQRQIALVSGSLALGGGIWSMHFIGMLAFNMGTHVHYNPFITLLSMLPSVFASWVALQMLSNTTISPRQLILGGVLVGAGIGTMHYSGMAAMEMDATLKYDPYWFAASIAVAILMAMLALWVRFGLRNSKRFSSTQTTLVAGIIMGCAIAAMHYTGMAAARFIGDPEAPLTQDHSQNFLALIIGATTIAISLLALAGNLILRYRLLYRHMLENESRLRAIVDTAVDGIITIDGNGGLIAMNQAAEKLFGWTTAELLGKNINVLMPEPYHSEHDQYLKNYHSTRKAKIIGIGREVTALRKDGTQFPIRLAVGEAKIPGQKLFVGFVSDLSERIAMERELAARELQYRTLIANIPGVAFRAKADSPWPIIFISDAISALSGWDVQKFYAGEINLGNLIHPEDAERVINTLKPALQQKKSYVVEYRIIRRDGTERWVSESASGVYDDTGELIWIDGVIIDITDSKLRNAEFESVVHAISRALAVAEFDMKGNIINANENFLRLTGYEREELLGQHHSILCRPDDICSSEYQQLWDDLRGGNFINDEFLRVGKGNREIWIQAAYNPIFDADGKPWKIVKLATDLSGRKAMEMDLLIAKDRAEQAATAKGMFLANMSHEIRTPMNSIIGFTELLLDSPLQPDQFRHLQTVSRSARSLLKLLNDILDTAKLERGALELDQEVFSLKELCAQIIQELKISADKKSLELVFNYTATNHDFVFGDALRLRQVLVNLLGNAIKFTEQGRVTLEIVEADENISIKVMDTGIGIAADRIAHIFTPFTQADASMARRFGGTGLGTTIARQLTELMGGKINASSEPGRGSCFEVILPLPAAVPLRSTALPPTIALPVLRILIADDVPQNIEILQLMLTRQGHRTTTASDGLEAYQRFQHHEFDIVLMDIQMPELDGLQASKMIRQWEQQHKKTPTPIIALTASVLDQDRQNAKAAGMNGFASKPIELAALHAEIACCLMLTQRTDESQVPNKNNAQVSAEKAQIIDWTHALARWGDAGVLAKAIRQFCAGNQYFSSLLAPENSATLRQEAHRIRGAAANLGLAELAGIAARLEQSYAQQNTDPAQYIEEIQTALARIDQALDRLPQSQPRATPSAPDSAAPDLDLLRKLEQAYDQGTFDDARYRALAKQLAPAQLSALDNTLDQFDFDAAAALVRTWINAHPHSPEEQ